MDAGNLQRSRIDGFALSTFASTPDTAAFYANRLGLSLDWLADLPMGGAAEIIAMRRAAEAVLCGDANIVACVGADAMTKADFQSLVNDYSSWTCEFVWPYGAGGPTTVFCVDHRLLHAQVRRYARRFRPDMFEPAASRKWKSPGAPAPPIDHGAISSC